MSKYEPTAPWNQEFMEIMERIAEMLEDIRDRLEEL